MTDGHSVVAGGAVVSYFSGVVVAYFSGVVVSYFSGVVVAYFSGVVVSYFSGVVVAYFNGMLVFRQGAGGEQVRVVKLALGEVVVHQRTDGEHGKSHQRHQCGSKPPCT